MEMENERAPQGSPFSTCSSHRTIHRSKIVLATGNSQPQKCQMWMSFPNMHSTLKNTHTQTHTITRTKPSINIARSFGENQSWRWLLLQLRAHGYVCMSAWPPSSSSLPPSATSSIRNSCLYVYVSDELVADRQTNSEFKKKKHK